MKQIKDRFITKNDKMETNTEIENILIFKTNIKTETDYCSVKKILNLNKNMNEWSIDREDVDCVLRIESETLTENEIIELIEAFGFSCRELV